MRRSLLFVFVAAALASALGVAALAADSATSIQITHSAKWGPGGEGPMDTISGTVNAAPTDAKAVVFCFAGGVWWVQPWGNDYQASITKSGWSSSTHLGTKYIVLLVRPSFRTSSPLGELPSVGGDVLAKSPVVPGRN
jgi:hypothetical protein